MYKFTLSIYNNLYKHESFIKLLTQWTLQYLATDEIYSHSIH